MKELFNMAVQSYKDWQDRKIGDFELIRRQKEIITRIETMWHNSPASEFYNTREG